MEKQIFTVNGMKCEHCKASVEGALKGLNGVADAQVDLGAKKVTVEYDPAKVQPQAMKDAVEGLGRFELVL
jgi:copper chaperone